MPPGGDCTSAGRSGGIPTALVRVLGVFVVLRRDRRRIVRVPHLGGVHHHYERRAACRRAPVLLVHPAREAWVSMAAVGRFCAFLRWRRYTIRPRLVVPPPRSLERLVIPLRLGRLQRIPLTSSFAFLGQVAIGQGVTVCSQQRRARQYAACRCTA